MKEKKPQDKGLRRKGEIWYVNIQVGTERKEVRVGSDKSEARSLRSKLKLMALEGTLQGFFDAQKQSQEPQQVEKIITYSDAIEEHWENHLRFRKSKDDLRRLLNKTEELFGNRDISTLTWEEVEHFRNKRLGQVSASYCRKEVIMMGAVLDRQVKRKHLTFNPVKSVELPRVEDARDRILTDAEFRKLLSVKWDVDNRGCKMPKSLDPHVRLALIIADYTAMRIAEILSMKWSDVDLVNGIIFIPVSKTGKKRVVPIHDELRKILAGERKKSDQVIQFRGRHVKSIRKGFNQARKKAKLSDVRIHDFRHRAITRWVKEEKPINVIMTATGHRTYSAFQRYANLKEGDVLSLVGRKSELLPVITYEDYLKMA